MSAVEPGVVEQRGADGRPPVLEVRGLTKRYGGVTAVDGLDLHVARGEVLGVVGPNGAGKSTLVGLVCGALTPTEGSVLLDGADITAVDAARRARRGIGRTHQIPRPFGRMTVLENLLLASSTVPRGRSAASRRADAMEVLERTGLAAVASTPAGGLPLLRRKRLELARAMALSPRLILLDEIGAGLVESEIHELIDLVRTLRHEVEGMLLIEHVMDVITSCCDRTVVLDFGRHVTSGPTRAVLADPRVAAVYLGTAATRHSGTDATAPSSEPEDPTGDPTENDGPGTTPTPGRDLDAVLSSLVSVTPRAAGQPTAPLLEVQGLTVDYGGLRALRGVDVTVGAGEVVALLGANGAGKTTFAHAVAGAITPTSGTVRFGGTDITGLRADRVTALGLAQCLEGRRIFGTLTVEENLVLGAAGAEASAVRERLDSVYTLFPVLADRRAQSGTAMSGGQQQMLAVGRALMSAPRLLVLDEISLGLAPIAVDRLYDALGAVRRSGVSLVLVEQNIARGLDLADRAYVLSQGRVELSGTSAEVAADPALTSLYVGEAPDHDDHH